VNLKFSKCQNKPFKDRPFEAFHSQRSVVLQLNQKSAYVQSTYSSAAALAPINSASWHLSTDENWLIDRSVSDIFTIS